LVDCPADFFPILTFLKPARLKKGDEHTGNLSPLPRLHKSAPTRRERKATAHAMLYNVA
jgi:hypothetical protein